MAPPEILCAGMITVDLIIDSFKALPPLGETGRVSGVTLAAGGDALNQAFALAKLGNKVGLMGLIGDDGQGQFIKNCCAQHGIATQGVFVDPIRSTTTSLVMLDGSGERSFLSEENPLIATYGAEHVNLDIIHPGLKILSIGSIFTSKPFDMGVLAPLLEKAKSVGAITIADMVVDEQSYGLDALMQAWNHLDYVVPSELEARIFTRLTNPRDIAADFYKRGIKNIILKQGQRGAVAFSAAQEEIMCPAFSVSAVDTTGAGDNFVAGLIHCLVRQRPLAEALRFACAVAAISTQKIGAGAGLENLTQVEEFLSKQQQQVSDE